jgi:hypothetical protein
MLLKDMIADGYYENLLVDPAWRDAPHPQEHLPKFHDPEVLYRPSPENLPAPTAPVLTAVVAGSAASLSWTESTYAAHLIEEYRVYRSVGTAAFSLLTIVAIVRDFDTSILNSPYSYVDNTTNFGSFTYRYYIEAVPVRGPTSQSNTAALP